MGSHISLAHGVLAPSVLPIPRWYAVHTSSRHEQKVAIQLQGKGIEHLLPVYQETHRWHDRRVNLQLPLFPGYLFVRIISGQRLDVLKVPGVSKLVGFQSGPVPIDDAEISALRTGVSSGISLQPHPFLKTGSRVRVRTGSLRGLQGILVRKKDETRIVISVNLIMQSVSMEIDASEVEPID